MLKICKHPEWTHDVKISVPVDGGFEDQTCRVRYRLLDEDALDPTNPNDPIPLLRAVVVRIDELADEHGGPLQWNDAVRDTVFALPYAQAGLIRGYYRSVVGAAVGNFAGPGVPGPRAN